MKRLIRFYIPLVIIALLTFLLFNIVQNKIKSDRSVSEFDMIGSAAIYIKKKTIDLGKVRRYAPAEAIYSIINTGKTPFIINKVEVDCHCTVVDWSKAPVTSHDSTFITVRYDTSLPGYFLKKVTVYSNAENSPVLLVIRGEVIL